MRAVIHHRYGGPDVLELAEIDAPIPGPDDVLVRVRATTVNRTDCGFRAGKPAVVRFFSGLRRPKRPVLGSEFAGEVAAVGADVTEFAVGDRVFGVDQDRFGAHAEYTCVHRTSPVVATPEGLADDEAASMPDGFVLARTCLTWAGVRSGQRVLVYGASGSIGTAGVQLAKHLGATVTAVCDTRHLELVESLGADRVIDYTTEDFTRHGERYDVVFDAVGKTSFRRCRRLLVRGGVFATTDGGYVWHVPFLAALMWLPGRLGARRVMLPLPKYSKEHLLELVSLVEAGEYRAVIDSCRPLDDVVEATRYVETEQKTGNLVLTVEERGTP